MSTDEEPIGTAMVPERTALGEDRMVGKERWEEIRRAVRAERMSISELARRFELDRKTIRRCLREETWRPYQRAARTDTLLAEHATFLTARAPAVQYSARILYQELRQQRGYGGSYDTVKRFVQPLRAVRLQAERALVRFETPPGHQSQIDWGQARVHFRHRAVVRHVFVLTLGFSRRSFYRACSAETLPLFLDAHERAFEHFGGHTREHLYDRPRTVCHGGVGGGVVWNTTFKAFAEYWSFEPRVCRPYRAQTKGKVESGVKYARHRGALVATHPELAGKYQLRILPEHGPGAIARLTRQRRSTCAPMTPDPRQLGADVEVRDLGFYDAVGAGAAVAS